MWCVPSIFPGYTSIHQIIIAVISYLNTINIPSNEFDVTVANSIVIDIGNDALPLSG